MTVQVSFEWTLPQEIFAEDFKVDDLRNQVQQIVAISLFRDGRVSSGKAAEILGINRREFFELLFDKGVSFFDLDEEEIESEWLAVDQLSEELKQQGNGNQR